MALKSPWKISFYPDAGEAVAVMTTQGLAPADPWSNVDDLAAGIERRSWDELEESERAVANRLRAVQRAKTNSRRYFVANRLRYQWVLTFEGHGHHGMDGRDEVMAHMRRFTRRFHRKFGVMPWWFSPELHPGGHGWHVNFYVPKRLPHAELADVWGNGIVHVSDFAGQGRCYGRGLGFADKLRAAAKYACKYASKDWCEDVLSDGSHRYEVAQGFQPRKVESLATDVLDVIEQASMRLGGWPTAQWQSFESPGWVGPPTIVLQFDVSSGDLP